MTYGGGRQKLGEVDPELLADARWSLHWAAQVPAAVGATLVPPRSDFSHSALSWAGAGRGFASEAIAGGVRALLRVADLRAFAAREDGTPIGDGFAVAGRTLADALAQMAAEVSRASGRPVSAISRPVNEIPDHPVVHGAAFGPPDSAALSELSAWFANAALVLRDVAARPGASPVRCWPHHFDIASLTTLDSGADPEHARSIGVGMSPGDGSYGSPYFYVTPWPYPADRAQKPLAVGRWHTEGWFGGVLLAADVVQGDAGAQESRAREFIAEAFAACREMLGDR